MEGQGERRSERQSRSRSRSPDAGRRSNPTSLLPNSSVPQSDEHSFDNHIEDIVFPFVPENQQAPEEDIEIDNDDEIEDIEADSVDDYDTWRKMRDTYISYLPTEDRQSAEELLRRLEELRVQIDTLIEASRQILGCSIVRMLTFFTLIGAEMTFDSMGSPSTSLSPSTSSI
jgi:hypothetical protein